MKRIASFVLACTMILSLVGCGCEHEWSEATCTEPMTCSKCGKTDGESLGHTWEDATCTAPKTCMRCGVTEGNVGEHTWISDSVSNSKKRCSVCGETGDLPAVHSSCIEEVYDAYMMTLRCAKSFGWDQDSVYKDIYNSMVKLRKAVNDGNPYNFEARASELFGDPLPSKEECIANLSNMETYIVSEDSDSFSALMKKFAEIDSVAGTIAPDAVEIKAKDIEAVLRDLSIPAKIFGRVLAMLDMYDYTYLDDTTPKFLQFTENGFTYHWKAVGSYRIKLN